MADPYPQLAAKFEPLVRDALLRAWDRLRGTASLDTLSEAIQTGGAFAVLEYLRDIDAVVASELVPVLEDAILAGGRAVVEVLPAGAVLGPFTFSLVNPQAASYIRTYALDLIREISAETVEAVRLAVQSSLIAGRNPRAVARDFKSAIGLTRMREETVQRFRQALIDGDAAYVASLATADQRMVTAAEVGVTRQAQIDRMTEQMRARYVRQRSETIARTESLRALSIGQDQAIRQGQLLGVMSDRLGKQWIPRRGDGRTREPHLQTPGLNGVIPYNQLFATPLGPMAFPRDPNGTAANTINCRCRMKIVMLDD